MVSPPSYERSASLQSRRPLSTSPRLPAIPIPRGSTSSSTSYSHSQPSSARSPATSSSLSSYRSHPYPRRPSVQHLPSPTDSQNLPRIHLPPPSSNQRGGEIPGLASLALASPPEWFDRSRPPLSHSTSGGRPVLPPLHHSHSVRDGPSNIMPPPPLRPDSPASPHPYGIPGPGPGPGPGSSVPSSASLRPSYGYEPSPPLHRHSYGGGYRDDTSPPLRAVHEPYYHAAQQPPRPYPREHRPHPPPHYAPRTHARSRSQSETSVVSRPGEDGDMSISQGQGHGQGQNRRLAHLMSEQKRRESINSGFASLRTALPSSIPTDSKAIILRKAVSHIKHLESLVRRAGLEPAMAMSGGLAGGGGLSAGGGGRYEEWEGEDGEDEGDEDIIMEKGDLRVRVKEEDERWSRAG